MVTSEEYFNIKLLYRDNPDVVRTLDFFVEKYDGDNKLCDWMEMVKKAKGFVSSFYEGELESKVIYVLSKMFFNGEYEDEALERVGNCNVASTLKKIYSYDSLKEYILVPIYLIAKGDADYSKVAASLGNVLSDPGIVEELVSEIKRNFCDSNESNKS